MAELITNCLECCLCDGWEIRNCTVSTSDGFYCMGMRLLYGERISLSGDFEG